MPNGRGDCDDSERRVFINFVKGAKLKSQELLFDYDCGQTGAVFTECRRYRYALWRTWRNLDNPRRVAFIGVNPSVANEERNDRTVARCIQFAKDWGYDGMIMLNAFAWVQTTLDMELTVEHIGVENNATIVEREKQGDLIIAAWGVLCPLWREREIADLLGKSLFCLGTSKYGRPRHPLYTKRNCKPLPFVSTA